jgi:tetratricopeptide (TPR) repeat protein
MEDLYIIIHALNKALQSMPEEDTEGRALLLTSLGNSLTVWVERAETVDDTKLDSLLQVRETAVQLTLPNDPDWLGRLSNLAVAYLYRFLRTRNLNDLDTAVDKLQEVLRLMPQNHPFRSSCLRNLARCLAERLELTDSRMDRYSIMQAYDESLNLVQSWDPDHTKTRCHLMTVLLQSYDLTESLEDLNKVIQDLRQMASSTLEQDPLHSEILMNLGSALQRRAERLRSSDDLHAAIEALQRTVRIRSADSLARGRAWTNLGAALMTLYDWSGEGFDEAFNAHEEALRLIAEDSNYRILCNLGVLFHMRFDKMGSLDDLRKAIGFKREAVEKSSTDMYQVWGLKGLGDALQALFEKTGSENDLNAAVKAFEEGFTCIQSPPSKRIISAMRGANLASSTNSRKASYLCTKAVELLPIASPRTLNRDDQQYALSRFNGIAASAAALAVSVGEGNFEALRLLELGRGVIISTELETSSDITDLNSMHPGLATKFRALRDKLDVPQYPRSDVVGAHTLSSSSPSRYAVSQELDEIIKSIRSQEGFKGFLLGPSIAELMELASEGPLVYLNASCFSNGSFLITTTGVEYLPLPDLKIEDIEQNAASLTMALKNDSAITRRKSSIPTMRKILKWLWDVAVQPILQRLGFTETPRNEDDWPRVWWIPVGQLNLFPFHAADGRSHDKRPHDGRSTLDRVISSYTPTIRALGYARGKVKQQKKAQPCTTVLMAVMPETPHMNPLPFTKIEVNSINELLPPSIPREILLKPTKSKLLEKIEQCSVAHFSCHGGIDSNPSKSQIYLEDWESNPLTVGDMARLKLSQVQLAYLSACHAANSSDPQLLDEALHMAGACQLAGFPSVVGSLWQVSDSQSATLTRYFYKSLLDKDNRVDLYKAASALHFAVRKIRNTDHQRLDDPVVWAPYIHVGV